MEREFGGGCTPLVINGCCGNVHHTNHLDPMARSDHLEMGRLLADSTARALADMAAVAETPFAWAHRVLPVPRREIPDELLAEAKAMLRDHPEPLWKDEEHIRVEWDWVYAVGIVDIERERGEHPCYPYEVQALRVGDLAILGLMGEPFVEAQLRIKSESPFPFTQVGHMCNGYLGYVPTERAFASGGYETRTGRGSRLVPEALGMIEAEALGVLRELRARR